MVLKWLKQRDFAPILWLVLLFLVSFRLGDVPAVWFDEGWALSLARNWIELGHYGHLLEGNPVPATILNTGFPAIAPLAFSFRLLGIGLWQGRVPGVFFTLGGCGLLYCLASRLYGRRVGVATLAAALFLSGYLDLHPVLLGRQALGEMPAVFYLLGGYLFLLSAWRKPFGSLILAALFWGLAMRTKPQVFPFFLVSLAVPMVVALFKRCWRTAAILAFGMIGALLVNAVLSWGQTQLLASQFFSQASGNDPYSMVKDLNSFFIYIFVLVPVVRRRVFLVVVLFMLGLPVLIGLGYVGWKFVKAYRTLEMDKSETVTALVLWIFSASGFAWFLFLSIGFPRYLFPAAFVGNIFLALLVRDFTHDFNWVDTLKRGAQILKRSNFGWHLLGTNFIILLLFISFFLTLVMLYNSYVSASSNDILETTEFINTQTETDALIETYESELFFLLNRPYHYPPDAVQHLANRRTFLSQDVSLDYDPLAVNPDYLIMGNSARLWDLYAPVLTTDAFEHVYSNGRYEIYKRRN